MKLASPICLALVLLLPLSPPVDWSRFSGRWEGSGTFQGKPATGAIHWEGVLSGKFQRLGIALSLDNRVTFEGHAYYDLKPGAEIRGSWFDSQGFSYPIKATMSDDSLVALWGIDPAQPNGRSVYQLTGDNLLVSDYILRSGEWKQFARIEYRRTQ